MVKVDLSLSDALKSFVDERAADGGFETASDYVSDLIQREHDTARFRALIREGLESPIVGYADDAYFDRLRLIARGAG